jgi:hypothetical protein
MSQQEDEEAGRDFQGIFSDTDECVELTLGAIEMVLPNGHYILEEDYRVSGEVWRVHKGDADPYQNPPMARFVRHTPAYVRAGLGAT